MTEINYRGVTFSLSDNKDRPSCFVLSAPKSGSTILNEMVNALAETHGFGTCDLTRLFFEVGLRQRDWRFDSKLASLVQGGNVYGGFRELPMGLQSAPCFVSSPKVLLVRDPRDALISLYFSSAYSHPIPSTGPARKQMLALRRRARNKSLESHVLAQAPHMASTLMDYVPLLPDPLLKLYRYEDVIFEKRWLLQSISTHFGWPIDSDAIERILAWADVIPQKERPKQFIRKVRPGDHKDKLSEFEIAKLNVILAKPLQAFGYAD